MTVFWEILMAINCNNFQSRYGTHPWCQSKLPLSGMFSPKRRVVKPLQNVWTLDYCWHAGNLVSSTRDECHSMRATSAGTWAERCPSSYKSLLLPILIQCFINMLILECFLEPGAHRCLPGLVMGLAAHIPQWHIPVPYLGTIDKLYYSVPQWQTASRSGYWFCMSHVTMWHIFPNMVIINTNMDASVTCRLNEMPCWPGLNHFKSLGSMGQFADGTKFEDHSKVHFSH